MPEKSRLSPTHTYVFDDEDVDQLDSMSLTSVLDETADLLDGNETDVDSGAETVELEGLHPTETDPDLDETARLVNALLESDDPVEAEVATDADAGEVTWTPGEADADEATWTPGAGDTGTHDSVEILLPPDALFSNDPDDE